MKQISFFIVISALVFSCNSTSKKSETIAEKTKIQQKVEEFALLP
jgi:hypothetical protein